MLEWAAAGAAGLSVATATLAVAGASVSPASPWSSAQAQRLRSWWAREAATAGAGASGWSPGRVLHAIQLPAAVAGAVCGLLLTGLPVLALVGAAGALGAVRALLQARAGARRRALQDAVLESVRMLRQLLETGGVGVAQAIEVLGARGPRPLREEFHRIAMAAGSGGPAEAWRSARLRVGEPVFDLLAAGILIQRPSGGRLGPLFAELEGSVAAIHEVVREAEALQVQARSAAALILMLPLAFVVALSALHSPYLDAYRTWSGELFLGAMLALMATTYVYIRRLLRLPQEPRLALADA